MNLLLMEKQLPCPGRICRIKAVAFLKRADVHVVNEGFSIPDRGEAVRNVGLASAQRLNLCAA
ncbi:hypothetical protein D3C75_1037330 [compost metagenome]